MPLFLCTLLGIPVPYTSFFQNGALADHTGVILEGDLGMPPTQVSWLPAFMNVLWNGVLVMLFWKTFTVLDLGEHVVGYRVMYRPYGNRCSDAWQVLPRIVTTRFVALKNGKESCEFSAVDLMGAPMKVKPIERGGKEIIAATVGTSVTFV